MFRKYENESIRANVTLSRHAMLRWLGLAFFGFLAFLVLVGSITYYSVQELKVPVKYENNHSTQYERGGSDE